ncbi:hypothetical protein [Candidatus Methylomicrobium oryzae]|uniref:hypothetical protein n=1 Tax=Candidatus Methylomicrobium oryzae TaxID=2802053 RepID=UPI0019227A7B|nr:hypothetical protein [Methylomicrobium sp. RS1]MBL1265411.1 hypothetical protein [Methylomicrobium sp. RS1]
MQIQRTIQVLDEPRLVIDLPLSFVNQRIEILVITLDDSDSAHSRKRRTPPPKLAGRVQELGDVMSSAPPEDWGHHE